MHLLADNHKMDVDHKDAKTKQLCFSFTFRVGPEAALR